MEIYKKVREENGSIILERTRTAEVRKKKVLEKLRDQLTDVQSEIDRLQVRKIELRDKIAEIDAIV